MAENKENTLDHEENITPEIKKQIEGMVDLQKEPKIPAGVETWIRKIETDPTTKTKGQKPSDDDSVLQPLATTVTKITLPDDKTAFTSGFGKPINTAWRWLSEFILRIIKKEKGNVKFKEE